MAHPSHSVVDRDGQQRGEDRALVTKIKEYREKLGYKQSELAERVGARRENIVRLENRRYNPSMQLTMDIAKVFGVTVEKRFIFKNDAPQG